MKGKGRGKPIKETIETPVHHKAMEIPVEEIKENAVEEMKESPVKELQQNSAE